MKYRIFLYCGIILALFLGFPIRQTVFAATGPVQFQIQLKAPGSSTTDKNAIPKSTDLPVPSQGLPTDFGKLIEALFSWSLSIIGLVIFVRFFYAGIKWAFFSAGSSSQISEAQDMMKNAVYGALVLFSAWLILNTINPDLVHSTFNLEGISAINNNPLTNTSGTAGANGTGGTGGTNTTGGAAGTCLGKDDAGNGTCSNDVSKICTTDIECVDDNSVNGEGITASCINQDDGGNGVCDNNRSQTCTEDSDCVDAELNLPTCTNQDDSGLGTCSNDDTQPCEIDPDCQ
jgi:hypothetical protein